MKSNASEIVFKNIFSLIDCIIQSMATAYIIICVFAIQWGPLKSYGWAIWGLYVGLYLGLYQIIHAIIQTIIKRQTSYYDWLLGYWAGIGLFILFIIVADNEEHSFNLALIIPLVLAVYYSVLTWRISFQKK